MSERRQVRMEPMPKSHVKTAPQEGSFRYLPGDHWVTSLTQHQRDTILARAWAKERSPR